MYQDPAAVGLLDKIISGQALVSEGDWRVAIAAGIQDIRAKQAEASAALKLHNARLERLESGGRLWRWLGGLVVGVVSGHLQWVP